MQLITVKPDWYNDDMLSSSITNTKGNTVGSRSKIDLAYIAGFLDGDGSLMLQLKKRKDTKLGWRFVPTICLYQDSRHEESLLWIRQVLGIGYLSRRKDGITELRINGYSQTLEILNDLRPYLRLKQLQADRLIAANKILRGTKQSELSSSQLSTLVDNMLDVQEQNYVAKKKKTRQENMFILGLTP